MYEYAHAPTQPLHTALMTTRANGGLRTRSLWEAFLDMRRINAVHLRLGGLVVSDGQNLLYAIEGAANDLDVFHRLLKFSPCESAARQWWRMPIAARQYPRMTLSAPEMRPSELAWLWCELEQPVPDMEILPTLLNWLQHHQ